MTEHSLYSHRQSLQERSRFFGKIHNTVSVQMKHKKEDRHAAVLFLRGSPSKEDFLRGLNEAQHKSQDNKHGGDPLGSAGNLGVPSVALGLVHE